MNKVTSTLSLVVFLFGFSSAVTAKNSLNSSERCFSHAPDEPGSSIVTFKIKPNKALSDKPGGMAQITALEHIVNGTVYPPLDVYTPLSGTATYFDAKINISLVGTNRISRDGATTLIVDDYHVTLQRLLGGKQYGGSLIGITERYPLADASADTESRESGALTEISCKDF